MTDANTNTNANARPPALVLGDLEITVLVATRFALDGGAMFGVVPKPAWSRAHPADADNRIALVARVMLVTHRRAGYRALLDAGLGDAWGERERGMFALDGVALPDALRRAGVDPESVTDVVLTHLHWDHAGGVVCADPGGGPPTPSLPRARVHVGEAHRAYAERAAAKDRGSFRAPEMSVARGARGIPDGEGVEVLPGLFASRSDGHTAGLLLLEARGGGARAVFPADLLPLRAHARPAWGMAYDNFPLTVVEEKTRLVEGCARDGAFVVLEHDPAAPAVRVRAEGERWVADAAPELRDA